MLKYCNTVKNLNCSVRLISLMFCLVAANGSPTKATTIFPPVMTSGPTSKTTSTRFRRRITCYVCFEDRHCNNFDSASRQNVRTEECPGVCFTQSNFVVVFENEYET